MASNQKAMEQRALTAAREAGAPISTGDTTGEEPDFRFLTPNGALGIEVSEVLRPASTNFEIPPGGEIIPSGDYAKGTGKVSDNEHGSNAGQCVFLPRGKKQE